MGYGKFWLLSVKRQDLQNPASTVHFLFAISLSLCNQPFGAVATSAPSDTAQLFGLPLLLAFSSILAKCLAAGILVLASSHVLLIPCGIPTIQCQWVHLFVQLPHTHLDTLTFLLMQDQYQPNGQFKKTKVAFCVHNIAYQVGSQFSCTCQMELFACCRCGCSINTVTGPAVSASLCFPNRCNAHQDPQEHGQRICDMLLSCI